MARRPAEIRTTPTVKARPAAVRALVPRAERRGQILRIAAELFSKRGFAGTTTRQIAGAVGTSETVLFRHFPTKESLYTAILDQWAPAEDFERWLDELRAIADRRDDEGLFRAVITAILESYRREPAYHRLMLFAALEDHQLARIAHVKFATPISSLLREYVARRQSEGAFRRVRPEIVVNLLLGGAAQYAQATALGVNPLGLSDQDIVTQSVTLLAGLRT